MDNQKKPRNRFSPISLVVLLLIFEFSYEAASRITLAYFNDSTPVLFGLALLLVLVLNSFCCIVKSVMKNTTFLQEWRDSLFLK